MVKGVRRRHKRRARRRLRRDASMSLVSSPGTLLPPSTAPGDEPWESFAALRERHEAAGSSRPSRRIAIWLLLGVAIGCTCAAVSRLLRGSGDGRIHVHAVIQIAPLVALMAGIRAPRRFADGINSIAGRWQRVRGAPPAPDVELALYEHLRTHPSWCWLVLATCCLISGLAIALTPWLALIAFRCDTWLHTYFVWSDAPATALRGLLGGMVIVVPLSLLGFAASRAHLLSRPHIGWDPRATGWIGAGAGLGLCIGNLAGLSPISARASLLAAAIPCLIAAVLSATSTGAGSTADCTSSPDYLPDYLPDPPVWRDRRATLLRAGIVGVGGCAWLVATPAANVAPRVLNDLIPIHTALLACAAGALLGVRNRSDRVRSVGGFGLACAIAATVWALAVHIGRSDLDAATELAAGTLTLSMAVLGFAMSRGLLALLQRVAAQTKTGSLVLTRVLGVGCVVKVTVLLAARYGVPLDGVCVAAICGLLILGGLWVLLEPDLGVGTRQRRLGAVGAMALTVAGLLMVAGPAKVPAAAPAGRSAGTERPYDKASVRADRSVAPQAPPPQRSGSGVTTDSR